MWRLKVLITVCFAFAFGTLVAHADYRITDYQQQVHIQNDGRADIEKSVTYQFDSDMNGLYLKESLVAPKTSPRPYQWGGLEQIAIAKDNASFQSIGPKNDTSPIGYIETKTAHQVEEKVFYPVKAGERLTVRYHYQLNNLVTNWDDVAEINWAILSRWAVDLANIKITVNLPAQTVSPLKAWGHSGAQPGGHVTVDRRSGQIMLTVARLPANKQIELHTYFDKKIVPLNQNVQVGQRAKPIDQQEANLTIKHTKTLRQLSIIGFILIPGLLISFLIVVIWFVLLTKKQLARARQQSGTNKPIMHHFDIPNDLGPAIINARIQQGAKPGQVIVATLMDLIARRKITLLYDQLTERQQVRYQIADETGLAPFEQQFMRMFFGKQRVAVYQSDLKKAQSPVLRRIRKAWPAVQRAVQTLPEATALIDQSRTEHVTRWKNLLLSIGSVGGIGIVFGLAWLVADTDIWQFWLVAGGEMLIGVPLLIWLFCQKTTFYTVPDGFTESWQWAGFAKMLHDMAKLRDKTVLDVQLWDKLLAYAVIFGEAKQVAKTLRQWADGDPQIDINLPVFLIYTSFGDDWAVDLTQGIQSGVSFESNVSGNGGSFSGGSSGGGGGSGGGAF